MLFVWLGLKRSAFVRKQLDVSHINRLQIGLLDAVLNRSWSLIVYYCFVDNCKKKQQQQQLIQLLGKIAKKSKTAKKFHESSEWFRFYRFRLYLMGLNVQISENWLSSWSSFLVSLIHTDSLAVSLVLDSLIRYSSVKVMECQFWLKWVLSFDCHSP